MADNQIAVNITADSSGLNDAANTASQSLDALNQKTQAFADAYGGTNGAAPLVDAFAQSGQAADALQAHITNLGTAYEATSSRVEASQAKAARQAEQTFRPIERAFDTSIQGMVLGTQTFQQAVNRLGRSILAEFVDNTVKGMVDSWIEGETTKSAATQAGNTLRTASNVTANNASAASDSATQKSSVIGHAWSAAAAVYDEVAQIPYVGWVLAPPAAAAAAVAVLGFGNAIPSAAGGWQVPEDTLAQVHKDEMILPAHLSQGLQGLVENGGGQAGHTFNINYNANGRLSKRDIEEHAGTLTSIMQKHARNGAFS